jgi:type II secretory pathway component GspD/PulD (secretin)
MFRAIEDRIERQWTEEPGRNDTETTWMDPGIATDWRRKPFVGGSFDRVEGGTLSFSVLNDAIDLDFVLTILHSQIEARLLANPRILVLDNETANFEIVREIPYREIKEVVREDPQTYTDFKKVGVNLKVTPHIARDGVLRLHIVPKFSVLVSQDLRGLPTIDDRFADTKAMIRDGQTITIGGLRKREITKDIAKVPVLADIPLVGGLFSSETESQVINELIVFITTKIITEPTLSETEKKLLGETAFTSPESRKTRIEKGEFEKTEVEKADTEKADIKDSLDLLLEKLKPPSND